MRTLKPSKKHKPAPATQRDKKRNSVKASSRPNPPEQLLGKLIDLVNLLPRGVAPWVRTAFEQRGLRAELKVAPHGLPSNDARGDEVSWIADKLGERHLSVMRNIVDSLPEEIGSFVYRNQPGDFFAQPGSQAAQRYFFLVEAQNFLGEIVRNSTPGAQYSARPQAFLMMDAEGRLVFETPLLKCFAGVDLRRIRQCVTCQKIFWANHSAKRACSDKCSQAERQRLWYAKHAQELKAKRIAKADEREKGK